MSTSEALDLSRLPAFQLVPVDYEALLAAMKAGFVERWQAARALDPELPAYDVDML